MPGQLILVDGTVAVGVVLGEALPRLLQLRVVKVLAHHPVLVLPPRQELHECDVGVAVLVDGVEGCVRPPSEHLVGLLVAVRVIGAAWDVVCRPLVDVRVQLRNAGDVFPDVIERVTSVPLRFPEFGELFKLDFAVLVVVQVLESLMELRVVPLLVRKTRSAVSNPWFTATDAPRN